MFWNSTQFKTRAAAGIISFLVTFSRRSKYISLKLPQTVYPAYFSLANLIICCYVATNTLEPWTVSVKKSFSLAQECGSLLAWRQQTAHCHNSSVATSWTPVQLQPTAFFILSDPRPWAYFIPTAITFSPNHAFEWEKKQKCLCPLGCGMVWTQQRTGEPLEL